MKKVLGVLAVLGLVVGVSFLGCGGGADGNATPDTTDEDVVTPPDKDGTDQGDNVVPPDTICTPKCDGKECGDDSCGGVCQPGCAVGVPCKEGKCDCTPKCENKNCGPDGCGGSCGDCPAGPDGEPGVCKTDGTCCEPKCTGKQCGSNGCGGNCGSCPPPGGKPELTKCDETTFLCVEETTIEQGTCKGIFQCFETCQDADKACYQACVSAADVDAQILYNEIIQCLDENGYFNCAENDNDCFNAAFTPCKDKYYECIHGDMTCKELYQCLGSCPAQEVDPDCSGDCFGEGSVDALKTWDVFIDCLDANGYFDCGEEDQACWQAAWDKCDAEFNACVGVGTKTCKEVFLCIQECGNEQGCGQDCYLSGTAEAKDQYSAWETCLDDNGYFDCEDDPCAQTAWEKCQTVLSECAHGDQTCKQIYECMSACPPMDNLCVIGCFYDGSVEAQAAATALDNCVIEQCGENVDAECQDKARQGVCSPQYTACQGA